MLRYRFEHDDGVNPPKHGPWRDSVPEATKDALAAGYRTFAWTWPHKRGECQVVQTGGIPQPKEEV